MRTTDNIVVSIDNSDSFVASGRQVLSAETLEASPAERFVKLSLSSLARALLVDRVPTEAILYDEDVLMPRSTKPKTDAPPRPRLVRRGPTTAAAQPPDVPYDVIAARAYELFELGGREHGRHVEHWLQAEQECLEAMKPMRPVRRTATARSGA